jgi:hypothetical protein
MLMWFRREFLIDSARALQYANMLAEPLRG